MRITYLATNYPMVSHTFIQGEIESIESMGVEVDRVALNSPEAVDLVSDKNCAEAARDLLRQSNSSSDRRLRLCWRHHCVTLQRP